MKTIIVDGIRKLNMPSNKPCMLEECEWCGAKDTTRHNVFKDRCVACGRRARRLADCRLTRNQANVTKNLRALDKVLKEYAYLAAQGYKVPDEIKGYIEGRID